jgi:hypothetical protein
LLGLHFLVVVLSRLRLVLGLDGFQLGHGCKDFFLRLFLGREGRE